MYDNIWYKILNYGLEFIGRYYSSYRGFVVDNNDPKGLNRLRVISPIINPYENTEGVWAYPKTNWGGKDYGIQILPQKGDMVWVSFEHGDLAFPIWEFASFGKDEKPSEFDTPLKYGFKTPAGSIIIIDDTEDAESILVKRKGNKEYIKLELDKFTLEATEIKLGAKGDESAVMGDTLKQTLNDLITQIESLTVVCTAPGTVSSPPANITAFSTIKATLDTILSDKVKIDKV
jgi:hypothetical protein